MRQPLTKGTSGQSTGPDIIFDGIGGDIRQKNLEILGQGGELIVYGAAAGPNIFADPLSGAEIGRLVVSNQAIRGFSMWPLVSEQTTMRCRVENALLQLFELVKTEKLKIVSEASFSLAEAARAHRAIEERQTVGKVIIVP